MNLRAVSDKVFIIAEAGVNHNGDLAAALQLVDVAAEAGADAVKFQTFAVDSLVISTVSRSTYQARNLGGDGTQEDMLRSLALPDAAFLVLNDRAEQRGIEFMSTAFDRSSLDFLVDKIGIRRIKIPSGELTNIPFLISCAQKRLPLLVSTGMATISEVRCAMDAIVYGLTHNDQPKCLDEIVGMAAESDGQRRLNESVTLLQCTSSYPTPPEDVNLRAMLTMQAEFGVGVGFSDHTLGIEMSVAACALGATVIEKHFTPSRAMPGPDHAASLEPGELAEMVRCIRSVSLGLGSGVKEPTEEEGRVAPLTRKVLVAARNVSRGQTLTPEDVAAKRAGKGLSPTQYWRLIGSRASRDYRPDEVFEDPV